MKQKSMNRTRLLIALTGVGLASFAQAQTGEIIVPDADRSCDKAVDEMAVALRKNPESLLTEVSNRVGAAPWCACPLTKTAIQTVKASRDKVGEIVYAATVAAPEEYKTIATCALEVAPDAAEEVRQALLKAFGETSDERPSTGKGKEVAMIKQPLVNPLIDSLVDSDGNPFNLPARPGGFIDNIFIIPPAGFSNTIINVVEPPTEGQPPSNPPSGSPPKGTDSNPQNVNIRVR